MTPPGLAMASVSPAAWERGRERDLAALLLRLGADAQRRRRSSTRRSRRRSRSSPALDVALGMLLEEGLEAAFDRHRRLGRACREGVKAMGLELFSPDDDRSAVVTAVRAPDGIDVGRARARCCATGYGVTLAAGQGELKGKIFRIGHIGYFDVFDITTALAAVELALAELGADDRARRRGHARARGLRARAERRVRGSSSASRSPTRASSSCASASTSTSTANGDLAETIGDYDAIVIRSATKLTAELIERGDAPEGDRPRRRRRRQRRRRGGHAARNRRRQRARVDRHLGRRAHGRPAARARAQHPAGARGAEAGPLGALARGAGSSSRTRRSACSASAASASRSRAARSASGCASSPTTRSSRRSASASSASSASRAPDEVLAAADFLTLHLPLTPETRGSLGARGVRAACATACGSSTPPAASSSTRTRCVEALRSGKVAGAALDVFARGAVRGPAARARQRRRHAAPRRLDRGGAGPRRRDRRRAGRRRARGRRSSRTPSTSPRSAPRTSRCSARSSRSPRSSAGWRWSSPAGRAERIELAYYGALAELRHAAADGRGAERRLPGPRRPAGQLRQRAAGRGRARDRGRRGAQRRARRDFTNLFASTSASNGDEVARRRHDDRQREPALARARARLRARDRARAADGLLPLRRRAGRDRPRRDAVRRGRREHREHGRLAHPPRRQGADGALDRHASRRPSCRAPCASEGFDDARFDLAR